MRRGIAEFLRIPLLITAVFSAAGVAVAILDATASASTPLRSLAQALVPGSDAVQFASAVATGIVTVTSITFSVLLLAVQQTANSLTAVVFDQFLRRTTNRVYFGFFIGLSAYAFIVLGAARDHPAPVYGAAIMLILTVAALVVLLLLIHGTVDQMRPQSVVRSIHELALQARDRELLLLGRTRERPHSDPDRKRRRVPAPDNGYVVAIDIDRLAHVAGAAGPDAEVVVEATLGHYLMFDEVVATVIGLDAEDDTRDAEVLRAFRLDDVRDVRIEAGYAIDELQNICWYAASSAHQSPQTAIAAVRALRDLLARWLAAGERDRNPRAENERPLPVVYDDGAVPQVLGALARTIVATAESHEVQTCADAVEAFASIAARLRSEEDRSMFASMVRSVLPCIRTHPMVPDLVRALDGLRAAMIEHDHDAPRVVETLDELLESNTDGRPG